MLAWQPHCDYPEGPRDSLGGCLRGRADWHWLKQYRNHSGRKSEPSSIGEAVNDMLKRFRIEGKFDETKLISQWEKVMGAPIAKRTTKIYIRNKKLFVHLSSAPLKHELNMSRDRILVLLTKELGKPIVNEVVIK